MDTPKNELFEHLQQKVFVCIARCLLNLQHYEQSLKKLIPRYEVMSYGPSLNEKIEALSGSTLGSLIKQLTSTLLTTEQIQQRNESLRENPEPEKVSFRTTIARVYTDEDHQKLCLPLTDLVTKRNFLVHHFQSEFDLKSHDGCKTALSYLEDLNSLVKNQINELKILADDIVASSQQAVEFLNSPEAIRLIDEGLPPNSKALWLLTLEIQALKEAETQLNENGWTNLSKALEYLHDKQISNDSLSHLGVKSWPELLHATTLFRIAKRKNTETNRWERWYSSNLTSA